MSIEALAYMKNMMASLGIPYEFMRWKDKMPTDYFFEGEYIEENSDYRYENGLSESTFILRGYTRGEWQLLEEAKAKIEKSARKTAILPNGNGIAVFYDYGTPVPTNDAELKSIKINLKIQEWKVT